MPNKESINQKTFPEYIFVCIVTDILADRYFEINYQNN